MSIHLAVHSVQVQKALFYQSIGLRPRKSNYDIGRDVLCIHLMVKKYYTTIYTAAPSHLVLDWIKLLSFNIIIIYLSVHCQ